MKKKAGVIVCLLTSGILSVFLYILLHEFGHMIVMLSAGARITEFSILSAHVSSTGGRYTDLSDLWMHANGALFPLLLSFVCLLFYNKNFKNTFYRFFTWFFGLIPAASMLAWVVIPFAFLGGNAPPGDDVTMFLLNFSQSRSPLIVSAAAAVLIGISIVLITVKRVFHNFIEEILNVR